MKNARQNEVKHVQTNYYFDTYRGSAHSLIQAGLVERHQLPGEPGRGKKYATYMPDGTPKRGGPCTMPGVKTIRLINQDRFEVLLTVSFEEQEARSQSHHAARDLRAARLQAEEQVSTCAISL